MNAGSQSLTSMVEQSNQFKTIAKYLCHGLAPKSICESVGITDGRLSQIRQDPNFEKVLQEVSAEIAQEAINADEKWSDLETTALGNLLDMMKFNKDPNLNLRVAMVANRANRRMRPGNRPLDASDGAGRVTLRLTQRIVERLNGTAATDPPTDSGNAGTDNQSDGTTGELEDTRELSMSLNMTADDVEDLLDSNKGPGLGSMIPTLAGVE